jgi:hypothetical protein
MSERVILEFVKHFEVLRESQIGTCEIVVQLRHLPGTDNRHDGRGEDQGSLSKKR